MALLAKKSWHRLKITLIITGILSIATALANFSILSVSNASIYFFLGVGLVLASLWAKKKEREVIA